MSLTSAPVTPCSCADGWKPEGWAYCADCYEGQIERLRLATQYLKDLADRWPDQRHVIASIDLELIRQAYSPLPPAERTPIESTGGSK